MFCVIPKFHFCSKYLVGILLLIKPMHKLQIERARWGEKWGVATQKLSIMLMSLMTFNGR